MARISLSDITVQRAEKGAADGVGTLDAHAYAPISQVPVVARNKGIPYEVFESYTGSTHTGCSTTNGNATYLDPSITAADVGRLISGTGIPANAIVASVVVGVSFQVNVGAALAVVATATNSGLTFTFAPLPDKWLTTIVRGDVMPDQVVPGKTWSSGASDATRCYPTFDSGGTLYAGGPPQVDQTAPATTITAVIPLPDGQCLIAASDVQSVLTPATKCLLYKTTDVNKQGRTSTLVATLGAGGYITGFSFDCNTVGDFLIAMYGNKQDASTVSPNKNARQVYHCTDGGTTWAQTLDIGGYHNQHVHTPYVAPDGTGWVTTGDGDTAGTDVNALLDANRRAIWYSANKAARVAGTWQPVVLYDPDDPAYRLQAVPIVQYVAADGRTWMYVGEDSTTRGRIYRFDPADVAAGNLTPRVEVVYDPAPGYANNQATNPTGNNWTSPWYGFGVDPVTNILYCSSRTEQSYNRGRFMCSPDGINFINLTEHGVTGDGPGASKWAFVGDHAWYGARRFIRRNIVRIPGHAAREVLAITLRKDGTLATQADQWVISPALLGFSFKVVRFGLHVRVPGSSAVSVTGRHGSGGASICRAASDPSVANGATGTALSSSGTILPGLGQRFSRPLADELHIDLAADGGGTDATVFVVLERTSSTPVPTNY